MSNANLDQDDVQFFCQAAALRGESIFGLEIITISCDMVFTKCNDAASNDVIGAGTPATNDWLCSRDDKCQILANRLPSH